MSFAEEISNAINKKRNIKQSSLKAYILNLQKILKLLNEDVTIENLDKSLKDVEEVVDILKDKKVSTIRNYLASIVVYLNSDDDNEKLVEKYRELMQKYQNENNENLANNKKSDKQMKNWATILELKNILKRYKRTLDMNGSLKKDELDKKEFDLLQKYIVGSLYIGDKENPPLRNSYAEMEIIPFKDYKKLTDDEKNNNNYLVVKSKTTKFFSLGDFKTKDKYGIQEIKVGKDLNKALNIWLKYNKTEYLLLNSQGDAMSKNGLTKYLIKTFEPSGKQISSSLLRSIYISEAFPAQNKAKTELANKMLHSKEVQGSIYAKD